MSKIALVVTLKIADGKMDALLTALKGHAARCLKNEEGCLQFDVLRPTEAANEVRIYEVYADMKAVEDHRAGASISQFATESKGMVGERSIAVCELLN